MSSAKLMEQIVRKLGDAPDLHAPRWFRDRLAELVRQETIRQVDDFCMKLISHLDVRILRDASNGPLLDELFAHFLWHRMHRSVFWVRGFDDVYAPARALTDSLEDMIACAELARAVHPGMRAHLKAALRFCVQDFAQADRLLRGHPYPEHSFMASFMLGSRTYRDVFTGLRADDLNGSHEDLMTWKGMEELSKWRGLSGPILIFSCDAAYFDRFAAHAVESALEQIPQAKILIAVIGIGQSPSEARTVEDLGTVALAQRDRITVVHGTTAWELRPMTALGRFLAAREVHDRLSSPCFIFDIDIEFLPDMTGPIMKVVAEGALGVSFNVYGRAAFPWAKVAAAAVHVPGGHRGEFFYNVYVSYVRLVIGKKNWWIDQNALFAAYAMFRNYFPTAPIANTHRFLARGIAMASDPEVRQFKAEAGRRMRQLSDK